MAASKGLKLLGNLPFNENHCNKARSCSSLDLAVPELGLTCKHESSGRRFCVDYTDPGVRTWENNSGCKYDDCCIY